MRELDDSGDRINTGYYTIHPKINGDFKVYVELFTRGRENSGKPTTGHRRGNQRPVNLVYFAHFGNKIPIILQNAVVDTEEREFIDICDVSEICVTKILPHA